jgi:hypothetical protein
MIGTRRWATICLGTVTCAFAGLLVPRTGRALDFLPIPEPRLSIAELAGPWAISLGGNTGCGLSSMYVTTTLDATGSGLATIRGSSTGCPPAVTPGLSFRVESLNPDGSGTANLSCGPGCGWDFIIQVPRGMTNTFTVVDVAPENANNVLVGTAARQWSPSVPPPPPVGGL